MSKFKVGDKIESVSDTSIDIDIGGVYVVTEVGDDTVRFMDDAGSTRTRLARKYKLHTSATPPETIIHKGYTYTRGEPVTEWKWGMWADYEDLRVFVMSSVDPDGNVMCSHGSFADNYQYIPARLLTPAK